MSGTEEEIRRFGLAAELTNRLPLDWNPRILEVEDVVFQKFVQLNEKIGEPPLRSLLDEAARPLIERVEGRKEILEQVRAFNEGRAERNAATAEALRHYYGEDRAVKLLVKDCFRKPINDLLSRADRLLSEAKATIWPWKACEKVDEAEALLREAERLQKLLE